MPIDGAPATSPSGANEPSDPIANVPTEPLRMRTYSDAPSALWAMSVGPALVVAATAATNVSEPSRAMRYDENPLPGGTLESVEVLEEVEHMTLERRTATET